MKLKIPQPKNVKDCIALAESLNPKKQPLTIEILKTFPGCDQYSDEEATQIIQTFEQLTVIIFEAMTHCNSDVPVISLQDKISDKQTLNHLNKAA